MEHAVHCPSESRGCKTDWQLEVAYAVEEIKELPRWEKGEIGILRESKSRREGRKTERVPFVVGVRVGNRNKRKGRVEVV